MNRDNFNPVVSDIYEDKSYENAYKSLIQRLGKVLDLKLYSKN